MTRMIRFFMAVLCLGCALLLAPSAAATQTENAAMATDISGYQLVKEGQWKAAVAMAGSYFLIFAVMLITASRIVSYSVMAVILFTIAPLTFYLKKGKEKKNAG